MIFVKLVRNTLGRKTDPVGRVVTVLVGTAAPNNSNHRVNVSEKERTTVNASSPWFHLCHTASAWWRCLSDVKFILYKTFSYYISIILCLYKSSTFFTKLCSASLFIAFFLSWSSSGRYIANAAASGNVVMNSAH